MRASSISLSAFVLAGVLAGGCAEVPEVPEVASVEIPLLLHHESGIQYRLAADFELTARDGTVTTVSGQDDRESVVLNTIPGVYTVRLVEGWTMSRSTDGGLTFSVMPALLATRNPSSLRVITGRVNQLQFNFIALDASEEVRLKFGVKEHIRQLVGSLRVTEGLGVFAGYTGATVDLELSYEPDTSTEIDPLGTHSRVYITTLSALRFFNDSLGLLAPLASNFGGAFYFSSNDALADGQQRYFASFQAADGSSIDFAPTDAGFTLDASGFPLDNGFFAISVPVEIRTNGELILRGTIPLLSELL